MLNNLLNATLGAVILLDVLGVIVYFVVSGIVRARRQPSGRPSVAPCPAGAGGYALLAPEIPYASSPVPEPAPSPRGWSGLKGLRDRIAHRRDPAPVVEPVGVEAQQRKISTILNSFKEDV
jgi:hypothetical protein